ncbi:isoleucine--tRNA ligase [Sodalis-like secondary symbiont of Drepanosiphum platanoidis]|uniref:isoleucine--tRNA ligase n=1 Tax=Sodalis-like secondary symbiont of Drepanosiphum platanoidis TaxID=2994493 RepID=UPI003464591D
MNNYKNTLNLPNTNFSMRADLIHKEPKILKRWYKDNLYKLIRIAKKEKKIFLLHDGPPYANGSIHIGHAINKILKDFIIKSKGMMGYNAPYIPGWDCHGLPIELKVEKIFGKPKNKISSKNFRIFCRKYAQEQIDNQKKDFIRLGVLGDWKNPYLTMDFITEANIARTFGKMINKGYIYRGNKPIHWCTSCSSSISEAEVEYLDIISKSIYIKFLIKNFNSIKNNFSIKNYINNPIYFLIWTTTPWTIPANQAIAINPKIFYRLILIDKNYFIIADKLVNKIIKKICKFSYKKFGIIIGIKLKKLIIKHPFMNYNVPIVFGEHVNFDQGTGVVHIAPSHGPDDYIIGKKYNLKIENVIDKYGLYIKGINTILDSKKIFESNKIIINLLIKNNSLVFIKKIKHSYPHCWRHRIPIIFRTTPQWFVNIKSKNIQERFLKNINKINWIPSWGKNNIKNMILTRPDWCISRQRTWGVPLLIFIHKKTFKLHPNTLNIIDKVCKKIEKFGVQAWWDLDSKDILGKEHIYYNKVEDVLDVWFDSGSTSITVIKQLLDIKNKTSDLYLEGLDQYRGWFMSSLIISSAIKKHKPCKEILTHGFAIDKNGNKMSKSIGNIIKPQEIIKKFGSDIIRLWVSLSDYKNEISISEDKLQFSINSYRKIRNTIRFFLANINDFDPKLNIIKFENMIILDKWAISLTKIVQKKIINFYNEYNFFNVIKRIIKFCSIEMGSFYLDIIKDRQYTFYHNSFARRSCQTALYHIIEALVRWISPILSFTADEIWNFLPGKRKKYIFTEEWYNFLSYLPENYSMNHSFWKIIINIKNEVNKIIEDARINGIIKSSLEVNIKLFVKFDLMKKLKKIEKELPFILSTSQATVNKWIDSDKKSLLSKKIKGLKILLIKASGKKCPRCWYYTKSIKKNLNICNRCISNMKFPGEKREFV